MTNKLTKTQKAILNGAINNSTLIEICNKEKMNYGDIAQTISSLKCFGFNIEYAGLSSGTIYLDFYENMKNNNNIELINEGCVSKKIAHISDIHIGGENIEHTKRNIDLFLSFCIIKNIDTIINYGDFFFEPNSHHNILDEKLKKNPYKILELSNEMYPKIRGIKTILILGNHDIEFQKKIDNLSIKDLINDNRKDINVLGDRHYEINTGTSSIIIGHNIKNFYYNQYKTKDKVSLVIDGHTHNTNLIESSDCYKLTLPAYSSFNSNSFPEFIIEELILDNDIIQERILSLYKLKNNNIEQVGNPKTLILK